MSLDVTIKFYARFLFLYIFILPFYSIKSAIKSYKAQPKDLKGKIVLVSGAGNGLGREISKQLSQLGCIVLGVDLKPDDLEETVQIIRQQKGNKECAFGYVCDISNRLDVEKMRDEIISKFKKIDMLFNNAGIIYASKFEHSTPSNIERVVNINILGQIWMTQAFLKHMKERGEGHIVFTSSVAAHMPFKERTIYSTTKSALTGFVLGLRDELNVNPEHKNIYLSVAHPILVKSNNFIKSMNSALALKVEYAAGLLIDGARKNYFEYAIPGGELGLRIMKMAGLVPWKVYLLIKRKYGQKLEVGDLENLWHKYMTKTSQKNLFKSENFVGTDNRKK